MSKLFATDSIRSITVADLSCAAAMQVGRAAAAVLAKGTDSKGKIIIGKDSSVSSDILEAVICAGICSDGADAETLGVVPVPAVAYLVKKMEADAGIMISAAYNGSDSSRISLFSPDGLRFDSEIEDKIEQLVFNSANQSELRPNNDAGRILRCNTALNEYIDNVKSKIRTNLKGKKTAVACAGECAEKTAKRILRLLGAEVLIMPAPDSTSETGIDPKSTQIERLMDFVIENNCDCGLAIDWDGSSCIAVDEQGKLADGDSLLAIFAKDYKEQKKLRHNTAVIKATSSLGLLRFAEENEINTVTSGASSRCVLDRMIEGGYNLGGEKNGRIFFLDDSIASDGILCGAKLLEIMKKTGKKLSELAGEMPKLPQIALNVRISLRSRELWKNDTLITELIEKHEAALGGEGRILVRECGGAEPFIRIIAEGRDFSQINDIAVEIAKKIKERCAARG